MNNQQEQSKKERILKGFAVAGFVAIVIIIAWLGIRLVGVLPGALASLASVADTVYNYKKPAVLVVANKTNVGNGETVSLSWQVPSQRGTFALSYACLSGMSAEIIDGEELLPLTCDTNYNIGAVSGIDVNVFSERTRFADIVFTVDFIPTNATAPTASDTRKVTVTNSLIAADAGTSVEVTPPVPPAATSTPAAPAPTPTAPATVPSTAPTAPQTPTYVQVPVYGIPTSNPAGNTDLTARFITLGSFSTNRVFTPATTLNRTSTGAIQFEVKNTGTKTSNTWAYIMTLPNGTTYTSPKQAILKPNERSIITIGFPMDGVTPGTKSATVAITVIGDSNLLNNSFTTTISVR